MISKKRRNSASHNDGKRCEEKETKWLKLVPVPLLNYGIYGLQTQQYSYCSLHRTACFKATQTLQATYRASLSYQYSVVSFSTLRGFSCLHSPALCCLRCSIARFLLLLRHMQFVGGYRKSRIM